MATLANFDKNSQFQYSTNLMLVSNRRVKSTPKLKTMRKFKYVEYWRSRNVLGNIRHVYFLSSAIWDSVKWSLSITPPPTPPNPTHPHPSPPLHLVTTFRYLLSWFGLFSVVLNIFSCFGCLDCLLYSLTCYGRLQFVPRTKVF